MRLLVWVVIWIVLLAGSAWWLWRRARSAWGSTTQLGDVVGELEVLASATEIAIDAETTRRAESTPRHTPAAGRPIAEVRAEREAARTAYARFREHRRRQRRPAWARDVDFETNQSKRKADAR